VRDRKVFNNPVDIAMVAGVFITLFGPPRKPKLPWRWKPETYEKNMNSPVDPFALTKDDPFFNSKTGNKPDKG
jgi:hypothetical protein